MSDPIPPIRVRREPTPNLPTGIRLSRDDVAAPDRATDDDDRESMMAHVVQFALAVVAMTIGAALTLSAMVLSSISD